MDHKHDQTPAPWRVFPFAGTVLKNLQCIEVVLVYLTYRNLAQAHEDHHHKIAYQVMEYENRYDLVDDMDVIISATSV